MIERGEDLCLTTKPSESIWVRREGIRQHLQGIVAPESAVMGAPDLAHAAFPNQGGDFIGAEASADRHTHFFSPAVQGRKTPAIMLGRSREGAWARCDSRGCGVPESSWRRAVAPD